LWQAEWHWTGLSLSTSIPVVINTPVLQTHSSVTSAIEIGKKRGP
jgi:hypothetical protein